MRDSNYKSVPQNKAAVSITTNLYDRRALDATCDQPLVNSLNHLTFLTSSSAKVRETLANDGGLERLVCILHECKKESNWGLQSHRKKSIKEEKESALIAWKWTLAFQCLVLVGTRGTEHIRKRVVEAGIIPIIGTVLDNYLLIVRNFDNVTDSNFSQSFLKMISTLLYNDTNENSTNEHTNFNNNTNTNNTNDYDDNNNNNNDDNNKNDYNDGKQSKDYDLFNILNKDSELYKYLAQKKKSNNSDSIKPLDVSQISIEETLHDINDKINSPRFFINGILVPKDDDVVWSLQLLAFISKYSALKDLLQFTNLIDTLSLRSMIRTKKIEDLSSSILKNDLNFKDDDLDIDLLSNDSSDDQSKSTQLTQLTQSSCSNSQNIEPATQQSSTILINESMKNSNQILPSLHQLPSSSSSSLSSDSSLNSPKDEISDDQLNSPKSSSSSSSTSSSSKFKKLNFIKNRSQSISRSLLNSITKCEYNCKFNSNSNSAAKDEKILNLNELNVKLCYFYDKCKFNEKLNSIEKSNLKSEEYYKKWNYESYFNNPLNLKKSIDFDKNSIITHKLNIFPLVEKFTIKSLNTPDMCYWSGVIMRNSCRKDEQRGGVRQCASFDCGKWESFPRQFAKCRRCKRTKYCSKECQLKAWVYHKNWCVDSNSSSTSSNSHHHHGSTNPSVSNTTATATTTTTTTNVPNEGGVGVMTGTTTAAESEIVSRDEMVPSQLNETL